MYEEGRGVHKSDENAASWLRRAADHYSDISGVFQAEVDLAEMYQAGRLKRNDVEAYMWAAIVGTRVERRTDENVKEVSESMTEAQIAEAQRKVDLWIALHPPRPR
jgi:hypothetical protein